MGAPCSTAPLGSQALTGGSSAETWSGSRVQGSGARSGGLATPYLEVCRGLDCVKPHLTAAAARPSRRLSLVRIGQPSTNHRAAGPGGGDGGMGVHFRQVFSDSQGGEGEGQRTNGQIFQFHFS